jgi:hypothetical protein
MAESLVLRDRNPVPICAEAVDVARGAAGNEESVCRANFQASRRHLQQTETRRASETTTEISVSKSLSRAVPTRIATHAITRNFPGRSFTFEDGCERLGRVPLVVKEPAIRRPQICRLRLAPASGISA